MSPASETDASGQTTTTERVWAAVQRHPVATVFTLALVLRATVALAVSVTGVEINSDEAVFWRLATDRIAGDTAGWDGYERSVYRHSTALVWLLAAVQWLVGPYPAAGRLAVALVGAGVAALTVLVARRIWSPRAGLVAGLLVAVWPSQVVFSSLLLKDAVAWLGLVALALAASVFPRIKLRHFVAPLIAAGLLLALIGLARPTTMMAATGALLVAVWLARSDWTWRGAVAGTTAVFVVAVPAVVGYGPAGAELIERTPRQVEVRIEHAQGGCTTFAQPVEDPGVGDLIRRIPRGVTVMAFEPVPWRDVCEIWGELAKVEAAAWWVLMGLAILVAWRRRDRLPYLAFPLAVAGALIIVGAVGEANIGTAFRHRGEILWAVAVIAAGALEAKSSIRSS